MEAEKIALIFNRICGYTGRFFYAEGDRIVERGDWVKGGEREYTLEEAERWLAVELYSKKVITEMELQPLQDRMKRLKSYIQELGPEGRRLLMEREERAKKGDDECCERVDVAAVVQDAAEAAEVKRVLAMTEAAKHYAVVMDACLEEAARLLPRIEPVKTPRFEARIRIALALYNRATDIAKQADIDKYLDRLIEWYEAKDNPPGESPEAVPPPFFAGVKPHVSPTERLANLFLDFLESRVGVIFGEVKEDQDERANEGASDAPSP